MQIILRKTRIERILNLKTALNTLYLRNFDLLKVFTFDI